MKSILSGIIAFILGITSVFSGGQFFKVSIAVVNEVTEQSETINLEISNKTLLTASWDDYFSLEKKNGEEWKQVEIIGSFLDYAAVLSPFHTQKQTIDIKKMFGDYLSKGEYRISKEIDIGNIFNNRETVSAVFSVK